MREANEASTSIEVINSLSRNRADLSAVQRVDWAIDLIAAVKGLHELTPMQLNKLIRDSGNNIIRHTAEDGSIIQVDLEKFARYLPLHLIAVIMAWERDKSTFKYLLCGILLLHSMCDLAARMPKIEQILLDDVRVSEQLIDLVIYLLVLLGEYGQENYKTCNDMVLLHSALVACSLKLLTVIISPQYEEVAQVLIVYSKVDIFVDAALSAVCTDVAFLQTKLSAELTESSGSSSPTAEETQNHLFQQCDSSLLFLQSLFQQKLFRESIVENKELCYNGGALILVDAVMKLKLPRPQSMSSPCMASISRLKSKALSILLHLCEAESVSYLDEVAGNADCQKLAELIAVQVLNLLRNMFGVAKKFDASSGAVYPHGQLEINALRLADVFSDDSNFRSIITVNFTETLAAIFLFPHGEFLSNWCSSDISLHDDDKNLDVPPGSYAHLRTSLLIKVIANLHCFVPYVCQDEKDLFLNKFVRFIKNKDREPFGWSINTHEPVKITASKNIRLLLSHAESLVPRFLNEDDMQLLRQFVSQFEARMVSAKEDHQIKPHASVSEVQPTLHGETPIGRSSNNVKMEDANLQDVSPADVTRDGNHQSFGGGTSLEKMEQGKSEATSMNASEIDRDARTVETSGSDSSPRRGNNINHGDHSKGSGFEETMDDEKSDALLSDDKQQRKRKRAIMNDKQISMIEAALIDEPDMHRNSAVLRSWADKLSLHGAEVTTSRLKNWLNNRKARLARAAKDIRASFEGDNLDKQGTLGHLDSAREAPHNDAHIASSSNAVIFNENKDPHLATAPSIEIRYPVQDQCVMLIDENKDVGLGKVHQVQGDWYGIRNLEQSGMCVVDITELRMDRHKKVPHPMEATGETFDETEKKLGLMRVVWKTRNLLCQFLC